MPSDARLRQLALAAAALAVAGVVLVGVEIATAPEPKGDGLPAAFAAAFALLFLAGSLAALVEAGLLWAGVTLWDPGPWSRQLLAAGTGAGALATLPRAVETLVFASDVAVEGPWIRLWVLFAVAGVACAGLGVLAAAVEPLDRPQGLALGGGTAALLALHVGSVALGTPGGFYWQLLVFGVACALLGGLLSIVGPLDRTVVRVPLAAVGLLALALVVVRTLAGDPGAVQFGLLALAPLWALASTFGSDSDVRSVTAAR